MSVEEGGVDGARNRSESLTKWALFVSVFAIAAYLVLGPLYFLIRATFWATDDSGLGAFERVFTGPGTLGLIRTTIVFAVGSTILATVMGTTAAYLYVRTNAPFKKVALVGSILPLIVPGVLYAIAWVFVASSEIGIVGKPLNDLLPIPVPNVVSTSGMIFVQSLHISPISFLMMIAALRSLDPSTEEAALISGAGRRTVLRRVTLPALRPALLSSGLLLFILSLESFDIPAILGLPVGDQVLTTRLYSIMRATPPDISGAGAISIALLLIAFAGVLLSNVLGRNRAAYGTVTGKAFRPTEIDLGRLRPLVGVLSLLYYGLVILLPIAALAYVSFLPFYQRLSWTVIDEFTLQNYRDTFSTDDLDVWRNSLVLAIATALCVVLLTAIAAWIVVRSTIRGSALLDHLIVVPLVFPGIVLGLGISFVYLRLPIDIYATLYILLIAYCTRLLPYAMRFSVSSMYQVRAELEESAEICGATWLYSFRRILLPLVAPGLLSAAIFVMIASFREVSSSLLLVAPGTEVIGVRLFNLYNSGGFAEVAALGTAMVVALAVLVTVTNMIGRRWGVRVEADAGVVESVPASLVSAEAGSR